MGMRQMRCWPRSILIMLPLGSSEIVFLGKGKLRYGSLSSSSFIIIVIIGSVFLGMVVMVLNEISLQGEVITEPELGKREVVQFMVPVFVEKSSCMEDDASDVKGNGVNGVKRVTQKAGNDGPVIICGLNNGGT